MWTPINYAGSFMAPIFLFLCWVPLRMFEWYGAACIIHVGAAAKISHR